MIEIDNALQVSLSRPFLIYEGSDITGTVDGNAGPESYCSLSYTGASRYRLNREDHNQIFQFFLTAQGSERLAYCLDKFADGPYGDVPYQSTTFESLFPNATARQKTMLAWILANAFPTVNASDTFALVGVDDKASPVLDDNDAYAVVQIALWVLLGQIAPDEVYFLDCTTGAPHPKSDRLRAAVLKLLELAGSYADAGTAGNSSILGASTCTCSNELINCCNKGSIPGNPATPYLIFRGCPNEIRTVCGRVMVGPFRLLSNFNGQPAITIEPLCVCDDDFTATYVDFCGNPITLPTLNQEFYIALRMCSNSLCFRVKATLTGTITRVITMKPNSTALNYQPIGATF